MTSIRETQMQDAVLDACRAFRSFARETALATYTLAAVQLAARDNLPMDVAAAKIAEIRNQVAQALKSADAKQV